MRTLLEVALLVIGIARWVILVHIIMSWLIQFQVLNLRQSFVSRVWYGLDGLVEPVYRKVRGFLPNLSGIDLAPLVVLIGVFALERLLINNAGLF
ncbi:MAG: YggT family protein [Cypionkella sp.]|nr:YggT family protein [Cypionkella sp.]